MRLSGSWLWPLSGQAHRYGVGRACRARKRMIHVKICGLREEAHAVAAAEAGADYLGLVFVPNVRRAVQGQQARAIIAAVRGAGYQTPFVGLFVNLRPGAIRHTVEQLGLGAVQLSGDEPVSVLEQLGGIPVFKALRLTGAPHEDGWLQRAATDASVRVLIDAHVPGSYGGAGVVGNWQQAAELASRTDIMLAGGLSPANVAAAINQVRPWGVDVSSGVETDGVKDTDKIRAFIAASRQAAEHLP